MFLSHLSRKAFKGLLKHGASFAKPRTLHSDVSCLRIISVNPGTTISVNKYVLRNIEFKRWINTSQATMKKEIVTVNFIKQNGEKITTQGKEGDSLLDVVVDRNIDIDGFGTAYFLTYDQEGIYFLRLREGACEGTLACSTCHLIFNEEVFQKMKDKPSDEEMDMLDLAYGLTDTSRLGCQVFLTKELDGMEIKVPDTINDARQ